MYERMSEVAVELQVVVLEDVLERSPRAVLSQQIRHVRIHAGAHEPHQVVVVQILHRFAVLSEIARMENTGPLAYTDTLEKRFC